MKREDVDEHLRLPASPGALISPELLVGRSPFVEAVWARAIDGATILVAEPRRMGKTNALELVVSQPPEGWAAEMVSVQAAVTVAQVVATVTDRLSEHARFGDKAKSRLRALLGRVEGAGPITLSRGLDETPGDALIRTLAIVDEVLDDDARRLLLVLDELPDALLEAADSEEEGPRRCREFLAALRVSHQRFKRVRTVVNGSVGIHHVVARIGETHAILNHFTEVELGTLDQDDATTHANRLLAGSLPENCTWSDETLSAIWACAGGYPYLTQLIVDEVSKHVRPEMHVTAEVVHAIWTSQVLTGSQLVTGMGHLVDRLEKYYDRDVGPARALVDHAAKHGRIDLGEARAIVSERDDALRLLDKLARDGYLRRTASTTWQWQHRVLAAVWNFQRGF